MILFLQQLHSYVKFFTSYVKFFISKMSYVKFFYNEVYSYVKFFVKRMSRKLYKARTTGQNEKIDI